MRADLILTLVALTPDPDGARPALRPEDVTPGIIGFLVTLALVLACIPLFRSMTRKMRGVTARADADAAAGAVDAAETDAAEVDATDAGPGAGLPDAPPDTTARPDELVPPGVG